MANTASAPTSPVVTSDEMIVVVKDKNDMKSTDVVMMEFKVQNLVFCVARNKDGTPCRVFHPEKSLFTHVPSDAFDAHMELKVGELSTESDGVIVKRPRATIEAVDEAFAEGCRERSAKRKCPATKPTTTELPPTPVTNKTAASSSPELPSVITITDDKKCESPSDGGDAQHDPSKKKKSIVQIKILGRRVLRSQTNNILQRCIEDLNLQDVYSSGKKFTFFNVTENKHQTFPNIRAFLDHVQATVGINVEEELDLHPSKLFPSVAGIIHDETLFVQKRVIQDDSDSDDEVTHL